MTNIYMCAFYKSEHMHSSELETINHSYICLVTLVALVSCWDTVDLLVSKHNNAYRVKTPQHNLVLSVWWLPLHSTYQVKLLSSNDGNHIDWTTNHLLLPLRTLSHYSIPYNHCITLTQNGLWLFVTRTAPLLTFSPLKPPRFKPPSQ